MKLPYAHIGSPCSLTVALVLMLSAISLRADWPNTNATKWLQRPDRAGIDILAAQPAAGALPIILADDFQCRKTGPITDIHVWVSWLGNNPNWNVPITLAIWSDVPAITNGTVIIPSHPDKQRWTQTFAPGQYSGRVSSSAAGDELFWNPEPFPGGTPMGYDQQIWQYNFYPTNPFVQQGTDTAPVVYWLSMTAGTSVVPFGWKTSKRHWNDDAAFARVDPLGNVGPWQELRDPRSAANGPSLDLAFALTTGPLVTNPPPANKWAQYPDQNGYDVNATFPNIVADDFPCTAAGTITNIQLWASYKADASPINNAGFGLAIWTDVPAGNATIGTGPTYSHPGQLLCSNWFGPGEYTIASAGTGAEEFFDPTTGELSPETRIWHYDFKPKVPWCQKGSTDHPVVYWLSVYSQQPPGLLFGWKTSTNHWNDDAVYGHLSAAGGTVGDWRELRDPRTSNSLDLAFVLQNGPPSADCDNNLHDNLIPRPKFVQWPDPSNQGLDVRATANDILADDFLCRRPGPINAVTVWGSWLNDVVDTNAIFQLGLWTDVPAITNGPVPIPSHPGQLLCTQRFYPPSLTGAAPLRYKYRPAVTNVDEKFYDPNLPDAVSFIGNDRTICATISIPARTAGIKTAPPWHRKSTGCPSRP